MGPVLYSPAHYLSTPHALSLHQGQDLHVYVLAEHLTPSNEALQNAEIWGSNPYSPESDAVCMLQHGGLFDVFGGSSGARSSSGDDSSSAAIGGLTEDLCAVKFVLRIQPGEANLAASERHGIHSKSGSSSVTLSALQFDLIQHDTPEAAAVELARKEPKYGPQRPNYQKQSESSSSAQSTSGSAFPSQTNTSDADLQNNPSSSDASSGATGANATAIGVNESGTAVIGSNSSNMNTTTSMTSQNTNSGASGSNGAMGGGNSKIRSGNSSRKPRRAIDEVDQRVTIDVLPDTILQFNLSNELSFQYNLNLICDRGIEPAQWTSHRLRQAVLMIETSQQRFELSWEDPETSKPSSSASNASASATNTVTGNENTSNGAQYDTYRFAMVKTPARKTRSWHSSRAVPLSDDDSTPIHSGLDWSQFVWGPTSLTVLGKAYPIRRIFWIARSGSPASATPGQSTSTTSSSAPSDKTTSARGSQSNGL